MDLWFFVASGVLLLGHGSGRHGNRVAFSRCRARRAGRTARFLSPTFPVILYRAVIASYAFVAKKSRKIKYTFYPSRLLRGCWQTICKMTGTSFQVSRTRSTRFVCEHVLVWTRSTRVLCKHVGQLFSASELPAASPFIDLMEGNLSEVMCRLNSCTHYELNVLNELNVLDELNYSINWMYSMN